MRTLALLALLVVPALVNAQESEAPEGAIIDSVEFSGFSPYELSPGLRRDIDALVGTPVNRDRLSALAVRLEGEQPEVVAAVRTISRAEGKAHVIFLFARISEDADLAENINARYMVESVEVSGAPRAVSQQLHDDLQKLVGRRLDTDEAEKLSDRLSTELPGRDVQRRISRGSQPGTIRVIFEVTETLWIPFTPPRSKIVYHEDQGWSGVLDVPMSRSRDRHRLTVGFLFGNSDDLLEEYSGFRVRFESRALATRRLGASLEVSRLNQTWEEATRSAVSADPAIPETYRTRVTVEPLVNVAFNPSVRVTFGASISELESLERSPGSQMASAWVIGVGADHRWEQSASVSQSIAVSYQARIATEALESDLVYKRHLAYGRYRYDQGKSTVVASASFGYISGTAPLFERFSLGDSSTLRGWNKYDLAPAGGDRMFHQSLEYRYHNVAVFLDTGSMWQRNTDLKVRLSTGFGVHTNQSFITLGFPLNTDDAGVTFMAGVRF